MTALTRKTLTELAWITGIVLLATILIQYLFADAFFSPYSVDFAIHDTYLVINFQTIILIAFTPLCFIVFLARTIFQRGKNSITLITAILTHALSLLILGNFKVLLRMIGNEAGGWTVYPPLVKVPTFHPFSENALMWTNVLMVSMSALLVFAVLKLVLQVFKK